MILQELRLRNYKQYVHLDLAFREGLVGIIGRNGAGKSTLFEAILYCLFGKDESSKEFIRSVLADPKSTVSLTLIFLVGEQQYRVEREFRGKALAVGAELYKNDQQIAKGVAAVNEAVARILGMEREGFKRSVFSGQKELDQLSDVGGEQRKRMVRKMLGLDRLDEIQSAVNSDIRDLKSQVIGQEQNLLPEEAVQALETGQMALRNKLQALQDTLTEAEKARSAQRAAYQEEKLRFDAEAQKYQQYNTLNTRHSALQERKAQLAQARLVLEKNIEELKAKAVALQTQSGIFDAFLKDKKQLEHLEQESRRQLNLEQRREQISKNADEQNTVQARLQAQQMQIKGQAALESEMREQVDKLQLTRNAIEFKLKLHQERNIELGAIKQRRDERRKQIADLQQIGREGTCPTCFQPVLDAYDSVLARLQDQVDLIESQELIKIEGELEQLRNEGLLLRKQEAEQAKALETLQAQHVRLSEVFKQLHQDERELERLHQEKIRLDLYVREIGQVDFDAARYQALKSSVGKQEPEYLQFKNEESYVLRELPAGERRLAQNIADQATAQSAFEQLSTEIQQLAFNPADYETARQRLTGFDAVLAEREAAVREAELQCLNTRNEVEKVQAQLQSNAAIKAQISDKLSEIDVLDRLAKLLGAFKTEILERVSPAISQEAGALFSRITQGKYESIRVDENFDFSIADGGVYYPIERFSGGEVDLANFCLRIAITKTIAELSGAEALGFLAFDEIFGSQDEARRYEIMSALHFLQEQFRQIYIISHNEGLKDQFQHILEVKNGVGGSTVGWI
jgi:DNA repair protein SbcC/Rad50